MVKDIVGISPRKPLLEMKKLMARPPGCTFLGSKATETTANINGVKDNETRVIIDSGLDIILISDEAWQNLSKVPWLSISFR